MVVPVMVVFIYLGFSHGGGASDATHRCLPSSVSWQAGFSSKLVYTSRGAVDAGDFR